MRLHEKIAPLLQDIGEKLKGAKRSKSGGTPMAGWGQFLDAEGHKEQVGPYGTCSAILFDQALNPGAVVDDDVVNLIDHFWHDPTETKKLRNQNVRIGFLVLALARVQNEKLTDIRDEAIALLKERQLSDGAWGDWVTTDKKGAPRQDTTAWVTLALFHAGTATAEVKKAQMYLLRFVGPDGGTDSSISDFAAAVLLSTLSPGSAPSKLRIRVKAELRSFEKTDAERISFFDYYENPDDAEQLSLKRDYLCYPAILTFSLLTFGLSKHSKLLDLYAASTGRILLASKLNEMVKSSQFYELPGAARAASVDQASIALSFDNLRNAEYFFDRWLATVRPFFVFLNQSLLARVVVPFVLAVVALFAIQDASNLLLLVPDLAWIDRTEIATAIGNNDSSIRLVAGVYLFFANSTPGRIWSHLKDRWLR